VPVLAFWIFTDNLSSVWPVLWVSLVMSAAAVFTLRASGPVPDPGSPEDSERRPARTNSHRATPNATRARNPVRRPASHAQ
jgi:hypothetical protein